MKRKVGPWGHPGTFEFLQDEQAMGAARPLELAQGRSGLEVSWVQGCSGQPSGLGCSGLRQQASSLRVARQLSSQSTLAPRASLGDS